MILVPVLPSATVRSWPRFDAGGRALYLSLHEALRREYRTDAHFAAYSVPSLARRLSTDAADRVRVPLVLAVFDVDRDGHARADDAWWRAFVAQLDPLRRDHPGVVAYRTRGGARFMYALPTPFVLESREERELWRVEYLGWCGFLLNRYGIHADPACQDWTRVYRAPHATRDEGGQPERLDTLGDPRAIGPWAPVLNEADAAAARKLRPERKASASSGRFATPSSYTGDGLFFWLLRARGHVGATIDTSRGRAWVIHCPNAAQHSTGAPFDTSTVLYPPRAGSELGCIFCRHGHCQAISTRAWLRFFSDGELAAARRAAGIPERAA